jgi:rhomboid protease GluP
MDKDFITEIIGDMNKIYNYGVIDIKGNYKLASNWALLKNIDDAKRVIIFVNEESEDYESLILSLKQKFNSSNIELVKVLLIDNYIFESDKDSDVIALDYVNNKILSFSYRSEQTAYELANLLHYKQVQKQNKVSRKKYYITYGLIAINVLVYILTAYLSQNFINSDSNVLVFLGAKYNKLINEGEYYRLVSAMFLHGGIVHLGFNMYALYSIGPMIEKLYGKVNYLLIYFISGVLSSLFSYFFSQGISVGASGAIFGLLGTAFVFAFKMRNNIGKDFLRSIVSVIITNIIIGFTIPNIDNFAHLGGLIGGLLASVVINVSNKK